MTRSDGQEKQQLRQLISASLRDLPADQSQFVGQVACDALVAWEGFARARELVAFSSLPGEVDTRPFLDAARSTDKAILLPRIVDDNLEFALSTEGDRLVRGPYGVLEPGPEAAARSIAREAIILVPGIAFDVRGGRLGRGAGYYDRALAGLRRDFEPTAIIGLGFALQLVEQVPMTPQDVHVDGILTEDGLIWADPRRSDDADRDGESTK